MFPSHSLGFREVGARWRPLNHAYTRAKCTWACPGPSRDPSEPCIYTSEVDLGLFWLGTPPCGTLLNHAYVRAKCTLTHSDKVPPRQTFDMLWPNGHPQNHAYTRAKWTWAQSGLIRVPCGTPLDYAYKRAKCTWAHSGLQCPLRIPMGPLWTMHKVE